MEERPSLWRVAKNILKSNRGQPTRGSLPTWGLGDVLTNPHRKNWPCFETNACASVLD